MSCTFFCAKQFSRESVLYNANRRVIQLLVEMINKKAVNPLILLEHHSVGEENAIYG
jgi:hypothetical protein